MKRIFVLVVGLGLVAGAMTSAEASRNGRVERTVEASYGPYPAPVTGCNSALGQWACLIIKTRPTEAFFTAKVTDTHGRPVFVQVLTDGGQEIVFCGKTSKPIAVRPGSELSFHIGLSNWLLTRECPADQVKTTGKIQVTLSNGR